MALVVTIWERLVLESFAAVPLRRWFCRLGLSLILLAPSLVSHAQTLGEALDAANLVWTTTGLGASGWLAQTNTSHDGVSAAQGASLPPGTYSFLQTTIEGPATVTFWWKASFSRIVCLVSGVQQASIYGPPGAPTDWRQQSIYIAPGSQTVQWVETTDGNGFPQACWLDEVEVIPGTSSPIIITQPVSQRTALGFNAILRVEAVGSLPIGYQWQHGGTNIPNVTASALSLTNILPGDFGSYRVVLTNAVGTNVSSEALLEESQIAAWGGQDQSHTVVQIAASNSTAISAAGLHSLALQADGTVVAWGDNNYAETLVPSGLSNVVAIAATHYHNLALRDNGTVKAWGSDVRRTPGVAYGPWVNLTSDPVAWTNIIAIAGGDAFIMGLTAEGRVVASGLYLPTESTISWISMPIPADLTNAVAISAGRNHALALRADGTVAAWGRNYETQTNTPVGLTNVVGIAAGDYYSLALKADGTVIGWGAYYAGQSTPPMGLSNVVAIAAGAEHSIALAGNGTVVTWGTNRYGQTTANTALSNVVAVAAGSYHNVALQRQSNRHPFLTTALINRAAPVAGSVQFYALATGERPLVYQWRFNGTNLPGAVGPILSKANLQPVDAGSYSVVVTNNYGAVTSSAASLAIYDFPGALGVTNVSWTTIGDRPWFVQTDVTHDGTAAVQSGAITNGGISTLQAPLTGPATLIYWWRVSSQTNSDFLTVKVGGVHQGAISGEVNWRLQTNYISSGSQLVEWTYSKDAAGTAGLDAAWLDQFQFVPGATAPVIVTQPKSRSQWPGLATAFSAAAIGTPPLSYQWRLHGTNLIGATDPSLEVTNVQASNIGTYSVVVTNMAGSVTSSLARLTFGNVVGWGDNSAEQLLVPPDLTNIVAVGGGARHAVALKSDGTVIAWGANDRRQCDVPAGLTNVIAIASHLGNHTLALKADGRVVAWGDNQSSQTNVPATLSNVVAIATGTRHSMALRSNGAATQWGSTGVGFNNKVAVAGGPDRSLFLSAEGGLLASGGPPNLPPGLTDIAAIGYGRQHGVALRWNGAVVAWGLNGLGQTDVPVGLSDVVAVAAGSNHCVALRLDGTVSGWGTFVGAVTNTPATPLDGLSNVVAIAAGANFDLAVLSDRPPLAQAIVVDPHWTNETFRVTVPTQNGYVYRMEYRLSPSNSPWNALPMESGNGSSQVLVDSNATNGMRVYRIRRW